MGKSGSPPGPAKESHDVPAEDGPIFLAIEPLDTTVLDLPPDARIVVIPFRALTAAFLSETRPKRVLTALFSPQTDAMVVAERLGALAFEGTLCLVAPVLPNPGLVTREIRSSAGSKDLKIELLTERSA